MKLLYGFHTTTQYMQNESIELQAINTLICQNKGGCQTFWQSNFEYKLLKKVVATTVEIEKSANS